MSCRAAGSATLLRLSLWCNIASLIAEMLHLCVARHFRLCYACRKINNREKERFCGLEEVVEGILSEIILHVRK